MKKVLPLIMSSVAVFALGATSLSSTSLAAPSNDNQVVNNDLRRGGRPYMNHAQMKEMRDKHHAALHDKLNLTSKQEAAWRKLMATTENMGPPAHMKANQYSKDNLNPIDSAQARLDNMKSHVNNMEAHIAAMKEFYATLTPSQQQIFDSEMRFRPRWGRRTGGLGPMGPCPLNSNAPGYGPQTNCDVPPEK